MPKTKLALTAPETITLDKLEISDANVRTLNAELGIDSLAADIARRGLLQSLSVHPILDEDGQETGRYGIQAGGRRYRALLRLVKQKKLDKSAPVACIVKRGGIAEADSLAENTEREALHPLDAFRAFKRLADQGQGEHQIAAAFGVTPHLVRQRLKLAAAAPELLDAYEQNTITLDQLMAFCIADDHGRQRDVLTAIATSWNKSPDRIRELLTETTVHAHDRRARFVGREDYEAAGGTILRDLFEDDDGGYFENPQLLDKLVAEKLQGMADGLKAEGWGWVKADVNFAFGYRHALRRLEPAEGALNAQEEELTHQLQEELELYTAEDEPSEETQARIAEIECELAGLDAKLPIYAKEDMAQAGVFVSLSHDGRACIEAGFVAIDGKAIQHEREPHTHVMPQDGPPAAQITEEDESEKPLSDKLVAELTLQRTVCLRNVIADDHGMAYLALLHALTLQVFYHSADTPLAVTVRTGLGVNMPGLNATPFGKRHDDRHAAWLKALPHDESGLWHYLQALPLADREALFAACVASALNAVVTPFQRNKAVLAQADALAKGLNLDMAEAGFEVTAANYLMRVSKAKILDAVRDAKGNNTARLIADLKKGDMANEAERLLRGTGWLPELLRTALPDNHDAEDSDDSAIPAFLEDALMAAE